MDGRLRNPKFNGWRLRATLRTLLSLFLIDVFLATGAGSLNALTISPIWRLLNILILIVGWPKNLALEEEEEEGVRLRFPPSPVLSTRFFCSNNLTTGMNSSSVCCRKDNRLNCVGLSDVVKGNFWDVR